MPIIDGVDWPTVDEATAARNEHYAECRLLTEAELVMLKTINRYIDGSEASSRERTRIAKPKKPPHVLPPDARCECGSTVNLTHAEDRYVCGCCQAMEIKRLRGIVDKLPKTADGVSVVPGMTVYHSHPVGGTIYEDVVHDLEPCSTTSEDSIWMDGCIDAERCYSTREAAEAKGTDDEVPADCPKLCPRAVDPEAASPEVCDLWPCAVEGDSRTLRRTDAQHKR